MYKVFMKKEAYSISRYLNVRVPARLLRRSFSFTRMAPSYRFNVYAVFDVLKMFNFKSGLAMFLGSEGLRVVIGRLSL